MLNTYTLVVITGLALICWGVGGRQMVKAAIVTAVFALVAAGLFSIL